MGFSTHRAQYVTISHSKGMAPFEDTREIRAARVEYFQLLV